MALKLILPLLLLCASFSVRAKDSEAKLRARLVQLEEMIAAKHARNHRRLQSWLKNREGKIPKTPDALLKAYYYIGTINAQIWMNYPTGNEQQDTQRYRRARSFLEVCALYEYDIDKVEMRMDKMEQMLQTRLKREKKHHWRVALNFMSYQESADFTFPGGQQVVYTTQRGPCVGGQWGYGNVYSEWSIDACYFQVRGNVGTENNEYFQRGISTQGFLFKPTYWKLLSDGEAGVGFSITALARKTDYTEPANSTVKPRLALPFGGSLEGRWKLSPRWMFTSSAGYMDASLLWSFGGLYEL